MKNNETLQKEVQDAIKWEPLLHAAEISVTANNGIITLTGTVDSFIKKIEAETAAKNVAGVIAVVEEIEINFRGAWRKNDNEIASEILNAFKWNWQIPNDKIKVKVEDGWITLEGEVNWNYQRLAAANVVIDLIGVKGVTNSIKINSEAHNEIEQRAIEGALGRNWSINDEDIHVNVDGNKVTLTGTVSSWYEKNEAEKITWNAPGVKNVSNDLIIEYKYSLIDYDSKN